MSMVGSSIPISPVQEQLTALKSEVALLHGEYKALHKLVLELDLTEKIASLIKQIGPLKGRVTNIENTLGIRATNQDPSSSSSSSSQLSLLLDASPLSSSLVATENDATQGVTSFVDALSEAFTGNGNGATPPTAEDLHTLTTRQRLSWPSSASSSTPSSTNTDIASKLTKLEAFFISEKGPLTKEEKQAASRIIDELQATMLTQDEQRRLEEIHMNWAINESMNQPH